jgi:NAD-dependent SIR2 family protein deacetylase
MHLLMESCELASAALREADGVIVAAGAGMGVDSGLPDFRGPQGFRRAYPPLAQRGLTFGQVANPSLFLTDPELAWGFYGHRHRLYCTTRPHKGFDVLRKWTESKPLGGFVFTSNTDGQFQKAGFKDELILECHGSIHFLQCVGPCSVNVWPATENFIDVDPFTFRARAPLPTCPHCGALARPNILMFGGDWGWLSVRRAAKEMNRVKWFANAARKTLVIIECGAGTAVRTVREYSEALARTRSIRLIRINPEAFVGPSGTISIPLPALEALTQIDKWMSPTF